MIGLAIFALVALADPARAQTAPVIEVEHDHITAGDLAAVIPGWQRAPQETRLLYAPLPGITRDLARAELERAAARQGLDTTLAATWPERLAVRRRMRTLEPREAESGITSALAARYRIPPEDVAVELVAWSGALVPAGELRFRVAGGLFRRSGEVAPVPLTWITREGRSGTVWVRARVAVRGRYAVTTKAIDPRQPIAAGDVTFCDGPLDASPERWLAGPADVLGKTLARRLNAGEKIPRSWLLQPKAVARGAVVELRLARGPLELRAPARAEQAGAIGERVAFRNLSSGRRVTARIADARTAEVDSAGGSP